MVESDGYFGGARLLISDVRVAAILMNEARCRTIERLLGVPRENSGLLTLIALATLAAAVRDKVDQALKVPQRADAILGGALLREGMQQICGPWSREVPTFGALVAIGVVAGNLHPMAKASWRGARAAAHDAHVVAHEGRADFDHRYGHLFRPNRAAPGREPAMWPVPSHH